MKLLSIAFEFIIYSLLLCLLGAPLFLMVVYPTEAHNFTEFSKTMIPWGVILLLSVIFSGGIKNLLATLSSKIENIKSFSAAGLATEFGQQDQHATDLTPEQIKNLHSQIQQLSEQNQGTANLASHFFLRFIGVTIYGSQFRFLESLERNPLSPNQAVDYYNQFIKIAPDGTDYPFHKWAAYLTDNFLVQFNEKNGQYQITPAAINFLNQARSANLNANSFAN